MNRTFACLSLAAACAAAPPAHATFLNNTTGLPNPDQTITFNEVALATGQLVTTQFPGVTFTGAWANQGQSTTYPNITGNRIGNFVGTNGATELVMDFQSKLGAVAFSMVTAIGGLSTFRAFLDGGQVGIETAATSPTDSRNFYGFQDIVFNRLTINVNSFDRALLLDNLQTQISAVPEPHAWALMLIGTLMVGRLTRSRSGRSGRG